jgi:serine protease Do
MKKCLFRMGILAAAALLMQGSVRAQDKDSVVDSRDMKHDFDEIIIKKTDGQPAKVTLEISKDGQVLINGKPADQYHDGNLNIILRKDDDNLEQLTIDSRPSPFLEGPDDIRVKLYQDMAQANQARAQMEIARQMERELRSDRAMLGVESRKANPMGALVQDVTKGSPAEKIGLQKEDVIIRIDNTKIENPQDLYEAIQDHKPEDKVVVTYLRTGKERKATAVLGRTNRSGTFSYQFRAPKMPPGPDFPRSFQYDNFDQGPKIGIRAQDTEDGKGAKVLEVDNQSSAQKAGIKPGDVITQFDGKEVTNAVVLADLAHEAKTKSSVPVKITRDGKPLNIEVKIPHELRTSDL